MKNNFKTAADILAKIKDLEAQKAKLIEARIAEIGQLFAQGNGLGISNELIIGFVLHVQNVADLDGCKQEKVSLKELLDLGHGVKMPRKAKQAVKEPKDLQQTNNDAAKELCEVQGA